MLLFHPDMMLVTPNTKYMEKKILLQKKRGRKNMKKKNEREKHALRTLSNLFTNCVSYNLTNCFSFQQQQKQKKITAKNIIISLIVSFSLWSLHKGYSFSIG